VFSAHLDVNRVANTELEVIGQTSRHLLQWMHLPHTQERIVAHRLQEDRDGADVFAEGAIEKEEVCHKKKLPIFSIGSLFFAIAAGEIPLKTL
jgi:hypothetical protein